MTELSALWVCFAASPLFGVAITLLAYEAAMAIRNRGRGHVLLNPVLLAAAMVVLLLKSTGTPLEVYTRTAQPISLLLGPAAVALAVPLYRHALAFRRAAAPLCVASVAGLLVASASAVAIAAWLGAPTAVLGSIAPKSATVAIAIGVSQSIGGVPALTAALTVGTGILTATLGPYILDAARVRDPQLRGLALGVAGHGIATTYALGVSSEMGAFAGLGMSLAGVLTGLLIPALWFAAGLGIRGP